MLLGYAYGNNWGKWGTRMHRYDFTSMEEDFYSEDSLENVRHESKFWKYEDNPCRNYLTMEKPHYLKLHVGESAKPSFTFFNVCYERTPATAVSFSNYDDAVISVDDGVVTGIAEGYTFADVSEDGFSCQILIYVYNASVSFNAEDKRVLSFVPMKKTYKPSLDGMEVKQIRGMATYSDGSEREICEATEGVTYHNYNPELINVNENGLIYPVGIIGMARVKVLCEDQAFEVEVEITQERNY